MEVGQERRRIIFFKIGSDRKNPSDAHLYGPYSLNELEEAIADKRINDQTLLFSAGMKGWTIVGETPLNPKKTKFNSNHSVADAPLFVLIEHGSKPIVALIEKAHSKECTLMGAGPIPVGNVSCSIYSGSTLKARNLKLNIETYNPKNQKAICKMIEMDDAAKKLVQNYAS